MTPPPIVLKKMFSDNDPTDFQLGLLQKILEPGADRSKVILCYYVAEVKYYKPYSKVCCFCVPYSGDFDDINRLYAEIHSCTTSKYTTEMVEETIFDCAYVENNPVLCTKTIAVDDNNDNDEEDDDEDDSDANVMSDEEAKYLG